MIMACARKTSFTWPSELDASFASHDKHHIFPAWGRGGWKGTAQIQAKPMRDNSTNERKVRMAQ
jgi:hypothetical protein